ncbi:hypothetical protein SAMD00023353_2100210 [Rosellinia necatrix]|uniref:Uncharacterized protein n=1 Tax=Rosellinia necatrix TaxID=77044 RepID=A0A1W2TFK5_ROSNE|nr:hypothetical protein SAMD00023353_2100210 [Rosellinia necatrix]
MFLHSGASLHGHEFSKRSTQAAGSPSNTRNPLLRSTIPPPANKAATFPVGLLPSRDNDAVPDLKKSKTYPEPGARISAHIPVDSVVPRDESLASQSETMSEDEASIVSDTDASRVSSSACRKRRSIPPKSTTYVLAHPPPKPRTKQRIIHMRPNLVLQIQQVTPGLRPKPTIDVYPSFAGARAIMAPLLKRVPLIAGIKRELGGQDIMLVRSEDYASQSSGSESDGDEDGIMGRDLLAVLSPSKAEDKTEIVMAEGTVWVATTRSSGNAYSYEFTCVDTTGTTITARWVRKQMVSGSLPSTPTSPNHTPAKLQFSDIKFTFSIIDPNCRRHPILATLTPASLTIPETYMAVLPSSNRYSSASQCLSPTDLPSPGDQGQTEGRMRSVEEWQKSFISVSAVWVALRHGWAPDFRPDEFMPFHASATVPPEGCLHGRGRSLSASANSSPSTIYLEATGRPKYQMGLRQHALRSAHNTPRRATSTGAAFVQKRRATLQENDGQPTDGENDRMTKLNRRALSGDWNVGLLKRARGNSLAESMMGSAHIPPKSDSETHQAPALVSPPLPLGRRAVSVYSPLSPLSLNPSDCGVSEPNEVHMDMTEKPHERENAGEVNSKRRHRKWKSMANWFRKLSAR